MLSSSSCLRFHEGHEIAPTFTPFTLCLACLLACLLSSFFLVYFSCTLLSVDFLAFFDHPSKSVVFGNPFGVQVLHNFGEDSKRKFLKFATGSDRAPIQGLGSKALVRSRPSFTSGFPERTRLLSRGRDSYNPFSENFPRVFYM